MPLEQCIVQIPKSTNSDKSIFLTFIKIDYWQGCKYFDRLIFNYIFAWVLLSLVKNYNWHVKLARYWYFYIENQGAPALRFDYCIINPSNQTKFLEISLRIKFIFISFIAEVFLLGIWLFDISVLKLYNVDLNYNS